MYSEVLEDVRGRVLKREKDREVMQLKHKLWNVAEPFDPKVVYLSVPELAKKVNVSQNVIREDIRKGKVAARFDLVNGRRRYVIHPKDAENYIQEKNQKRAMGSH